MSKKQDNGDDWDQQRDEGAGDGIVVKTIGTMVVLLLGLVGWVTYMDGMWKIDGMSKIGKDGLVKKSFDISKLKITFPSKENKNTAGKEKKNNKNIANLEGNDLVSVSGGDAFANSVNQPQSFAGMADQYKHSKLCSPSSAQFEKEVRNHWREWQTNTKTAVVDPRWSGSLFYCIIDNIVYRYRARCFRCNFFDGVEDRRVYSYAEALAQQSKDPSNWQKKLDLGRRDEGNFGQITMDPHSKKGLVEWTIEGNNLVKYACRGRYNEYTKELLNECRPGSTPTREVMGTRINGR